MRKQRLTAPGFPVVSSRIAAFLIFLLVLPGMAGVAAGQGKTDNATRVAQQQQTRFLYLGLEAGATYQIRTNESTVEQAASPDGTVGFSDAASTGESIVLTRTGVAEVCPEDPAGFGASDAGGACARFSWNTPATSEYVSDYRVYWGTTSGVYSDSSGFDILRVVEQSGTSYFTLCGFPEGTYYFALRAHNQFDCWSGLSGEASATIVGGVTQPPLPPTNVAATEAQPGCATVTWTASGSPGVTGYTVFWGSSSGVYTGSGPATGATSTEQCALAPGRWYFAVKTNNGSGESSVYSQEAILDVVGSDTTPPAFTQLKPPQGSTGVALNAQIFFVVTDTGAGVDGSTISVTVNGSAASVSPLGSPAQFIVVANAAGLLPANSTITVVATASDLADTPNEGFASWTFDTGDVVTEDSSPPVFSALSPANGESNASVDKPVRVTVSDSGLGLDLASIVFYVNDSPVAFALEGDIDSATLTYSGELTQGATVTVRVEVCDLASPANCTVLDDYSFTVAGANFVSLGEGAIVPDGFWANEPERPLEIRNLPIDWTVRIFDTAGTSVRRYRNQTTDGENWAWDFNNDHGIRVARAIYLVRVSDESGAIQRSGRFLVQIDP